MGPKTRKSVSLWQECEKCSCIISSKDVEAHSSECDLSVTERNHCFIHNKHLFAKVDELKVSDIDENIKSYKDDLIFISQSAMQLCGFIIGDPVVIRSKSSTFVKKAWPKNDGLLIGVKISNANSPHEINTNIFKEIATISNLNSCPIPVKKVFFKSRSSISNMSSFLGILRKYISNIYTTSSSISVQFYGQTIVIDLVKFEPVNKEITLDLSKLSLEDNFYIIMESTEWKPVESDQELIKHSGKVTLSHVGGYSSLTADLMREINLTLSSPVKAGDEQAFNGILLFGCHGTGKTLISEALANEAGTSVINFQVSDISSSSFSGDNMRRINDIFGKACSNEPCVILFDNIDSVAPASAEGVDRKMLAALSSGFDKLKHYRIVLIATAVSPENVHPALRRPGRLENEIEIGIPTEVERKDILSKYAPESDLVDGVKEVANIAHGYVGADLAAVVAQARSHAGMRSSQPSSDDLIWAVKRITPSAMKQAQLQVNKVKWADIGGQEDLKLKLKQAVEWPLVHPETFIRLGITPPKGILMFGPPGCSKTMIAKAIATETNLNFLSAKGSDIFSKWVGESEKAVRELFGRARRVAPAVIFLDEVDALCPARDGSTHGGGSAVQDRVLSQLLTEMDGVQPLNNVIIIAATNRPDRIDKAFLRPGRLDRMIYVPLPDYETRLQILKVTTRKTPLSPCVDLVSLAKSMEGYSGAETVAVCNEAAMNALEENMDISHVKIEHFYSALKSVTPRTPQSLLKIYEEYVNKSNYKS